MTMYTFNIGSVCLDNLYYTPGRGKIVPRNYTPGRGKIVPRNLN